MFITLDSIKDAKKSGSRAGEFCATCPNCGERTFYFNVYSKKYICFRESCKISGTFNNLGIEENIDSSLEEMKKSLNNLYVKNDINKINTVDLDLFSDSFDKNKYPFAYQYIKSRNFTDDDIEKYHLRVGKSYFSKEKEKTINRWKGRIIFPFLDCGKPIYAIGRAYNDAKPKYLNTDGEKSVIVYNIDNIRDRTCIVCEGLISSIFAQKFSNVSAVCLLGCSASDSQIWQIRSQANKVYVCLDGGVDSSSICKRFFSSGADVYKVNLPVIDGKGLDPAEMDKESYIKCIENAERFRLL